MLVCYHSTVLWYVSVNLKHQSFIFSFVMLAAISIFAP